MLKKNGTAPLAQKVRLDTILLRPQISIQDMMEYIPRVAGFIEKLGDHMAEEIEESELLIKYKGYIQKEQELADKLSRLEDIALAEELDYHKLKSLSSEAREKLSREKPRTIGQAARISGVSPADISVLIVYLGR